jgi:hypothetical protein
MAGQIKINRRRAATIRPFSQHARSFFDVPEKRLRFWDRDEGNAEPALWIVRGLVAAPYSNGPPSAAGDQFQFPDLSDLDADGTQISIT